MKVAVSIPDAVFEEGERMAQHLKTSRSELYARALAAFVASRTSNHVTEAINRVVDEVGAEPDPFTREAARQALERVEW